MRSRHSCGTRTSATAVAVSWEVAKYARLPRARRAALVVIGLRTTDGHCTGGRPPSFGVWQWCDMRAVTNTKPAFARHANKRHCAGCLSGNGKSRELAARAHCTALTVIGLHAMEGHYTGERPLFFCAPPWCDVRAVASNTQPAFAWHTHVRVPLRWLSLRRWQYARACSARAPCRADCDRPTHYGRVLHRRKASLLRWKSVVRRARCDLQHAAGFRAACAHAPLRWLSLGRRRNTKPCRARRAALLVIDPHTIEGYCIGGRPLPFGARPWCVVRAATSNTQPAFA